MSAEKRKRGRGRTIILAIIVLLVACGVLSFFVSLFSDSATPGADEPTAVVEEVAEVTEETTAEPTNEPEPTELPVPTDEPTAIPATLSPEEALTAAIVAALGSGNRDVDRVASVIDDDGRIEVDWAINDAFSENLTQGSAQLDATNILRAISESGYPYDFVLMRGTFPLVDQFGNTEEQKVVELFFEQATADQINFDGFDYRNVYDIADSAQIHPSFVRE